jgi:acetyl esterase/lipase
MLDITQIDPELLVALEDRPDFDIWENLPETRVKLREFAESYDAHLPVMDHVVFADHQIPEAGHNPDLRVRVYRPEKTVGPLPGLLWIHGGGYVMGSVDVEVPIMQRLVDEVGCVVVAVEYRLAPEHPYPAPLDDCYQALTWLFASAAELGVDEEKVAIGGISAGAGLASGLALMARDRGDYRIVYQLLLCPMLDDLNERPSTHMDLTGIGWDRRSNQKGWQAYLSGDYDADIHEYAIPSRVDDLSRLPPAYISVGTLDLFLDENLHYARRLMAAEVATELHVFPGGIHAFEYRAPGARLSSRAHYLNYEIFRHAFDR